MLEDRRPQTPLADVYARTDQEIFDVVKEVSLVSGLKPVTDAKRDDTKVVDVAGFKYAELKYSPDDLIVRLQKISIPDVSPELSEIYRELVEESVLKLKLLESRGPHTPEILELNTRLFGQPDASLEAAALATLREIEHVPANPADGLSFEQTAGIFRNYLREGYGFTDWQVVPVDTHRMSVQAAKKVIKVPEESIRKVEAAEIAPLLAHEIDCHVLRGENGSKQPYQILQKGTAGYLMTEEGLAFYAEDLAGGVPDKTKRAAAAFFIVVQRMYAGVAPSETFDELVSYGFEGKNANNFITSVYRGGGLTKDFYYFQGQREVAAAIDRGLNVKDLYLGKVSIEQAQKLAGQSESLGIVAPRDLLLPLSLTNPERFAELSKI